MDPGSFLWHSVFLVLALNVLIVDFELQSKFQMLLSSSKTP